MKRNILLTLSMALAIMAQAQQINHGSWGIRMDETTKTLNIERKGETVLQNVYATADCSFGSNAQMSTHKSTEATKVSYGKEDVSNCFGNGTKYDYIYRFDDGLVMTQSFEFYDNDADFITRLTLSTEEGATTISSNHLVPMATSTTQAIMPADKTSRMLWVPWDNDGFVGYSANYLRTEMNSYNVTAIYHPSDRYGIVAGAVDHDLWKSAIHVDATDYNKIKKFELMSGYTDEHSHDSLQWEGIIMPHGAVKSTTVASARFMFGCFDDWREGLETFGRTCAMVQPRREWEGGTPYGWSSWGVMQTKISYDGVIDVANFLKDNVRVHGFHDKQGRIVLSLDAWWNDNLSVDQVKKFVAYCRENNMIPGLYYGSFCDFGGYGNNEVPGTSGKYKYKDLWLKQNGRYKKIDGAYCLDPTHPGTKLFIAHDMKKFKDWGIEYLKCDFMSNGAIEADSWYDKNCHTGIQAYNQGMAFLRKQAGDGIYLLLSIAPMFPAHYVHGRRISCDAWGTIDHTKYVMNNSSYGWWLNQVYFANDPDHLVMHMDKENAKETEGVNRARITSGVVTGAFISGDNFSDNVDAGYPEQSRERALALLTNEAVNEIPRTCQAFRPMEGDATQSQAAENCMTFENEQYVYLAVINYGKLIFNQLRKAVTFERLGIESANVASVEELWTGKAVSFTATGFDCEVPFSDARIYRITKKNGTEGVRDIQATAERISVTASHGYLHIDCGTQAAKQITVYDITGKKVAGRAGTEGQYTYALDMTGCGNGVYVVDIKTDKGSVSRKIIL